MTEPAPEPSAGAIVHDDDGRVLLVRRANDPGAGRWSIPAGRLDPGETAAQAAAREVREETGLEVEVGEVAWQVDLRTEDRWFPVIDFLATVVGGELRPGDDATEVRWVDGPTYRTLDVVESVDTMLRTLGLLPP